MKKINKWKKKQELRAHMAPVKSSEEPRAHKPWALAKL